MENKSENKICQNCKKDFVIEPEDFNFYEKIKVPPPTFCPECRLIRRFAYNEERALYKDTCDMCNKDIVSLYSPGSPYKVYCPSCWWSDNWDAESYGKDYDFSRPFFEQLYDLQKLVPCPAVNLRNCTNCNYCHGLIRCKNCFMVFTGIQSINCMYSQGPIFSKDSADCDGVMNADHAYQTVNAVGVYNTKFVYFSNDCLESSFLFNCIGSSDCFGCVNLRNKRHHILNVPYSKEEYQKEIQKWDLGSYKILQEAEQKFLELYYKTPRRFIFSTNSVNVIGDDMENTKNSKYVFDTRHGVENCKYIYFCGLLLKDSYDVSIGGDTSELLYEVIGVTQSQKTFFADSVNNAVNVEYSESIYNGSNLFGCYKMRHKKYCILNKQYTKEEYEEILPKIKQHMVDMPYIDKKGRVYKYGEFYPPEHSMWAYNETIAAQWFPLTKEEALEKGYNWRDPAERNYKVTIKPEDLPDHINEVQDSIVNEIIGCEHDGQGCNEQCTTAFRIMPDELKFYRSMNVALPRMCPNCRYYKRLRTRNPQKLWHRKCMCGGDSSESGEYKNTVKHDHGDNPCANEFETAISDQRKEVLYCEKCYQDEFI